MAEQRSDFEERYGAEKMRQVFVWLIAAVLEHGGRLPVSEESVRIATVLYDGGFGNVGMHRPHEDAEVSPGVLGVVPSGPPALRYNPPADPHRYDTAAPVARAYLRWLNEENKAGPRRESKANSERYFDDLERAREHTADAEEAEAAGEENAGDDDDDEGREVEMERYHRDEIEEKVRDLARFVADRVAPHVDQPTLEQALLLELDRQVGRRTQANPGEERR